MDRHVVVAVPKICRGGVFPPAERPVWLISHLALKEEVTAEAEAVATKENVI